MKPTATSISNQQWGDLHTPLQFILSEIHKEFVEDYPEESISPKGIEAIELIMIKADKLIEELIERRIARVLDAQYATATDANGNEYTISIEDAPF